jgi:Zn-dependent protease
MPALYHPHVIIHAKMLNLDPPTIISRVITLLIAFTLHEFAHALSATLLGDETPRQNGRLTLNPLRHLDVFGSLLLIVAGFGWAKPVPINPYALRRRSPSAVMWVSLAGPASNFLMAAVGAFFLRFGLVTPSTTFYASSILPTPYQFLTDFVWLNLLLMLFNLIPISPLDGDKIYEYFAPPRLAQALDIIRPYGPMVLMALLFVPGFFGVDVLSWMMIPALPKLCWAASAFRSAWPWKTTRKG